MLQRRLYFCSNYSSSIGDEQHPKQDIINDKTMTSKYISGSSSNGNISPTLANDIIAGF